MFVLLQTHLQPLDEVLGLLLDEMDPFQDVGDVVDAPLGGVELLGDEVQVQHAVGGATQHLREPLRQQTEGGVTARPLEQGLARYGIGGGS